MHDGCGAFASAVRQGEGAGRGRGRTGEPRGAWREIAQSRGQTWWLQALKAVLVFLGLGRQSRLGALWEIMEEQGRAWSALCCCLSSPDSP